jgi:D-amino-acid dehydrogenase
MAGAEQHSDVVILGGGVIGLASAYYLLKAGRSVRVLERDTIGAATSFGNCGTLTPSHIPPLAAPGMISKAMKWMLTPDAPFYVKPTLDPQLISWLLKFAARCNASDWRQAALNKMQILHTSRRLIEELVTQDGFQCDFAASGLINVYATQKGFDAAARDAEAVKEFGLKTRILSSHALLDEEPALKPGLAGGIEYTGDGHLRPDRYCSEFARRVRELGGEIVEGAEVTALKNANSARPVVQTSEAEYSADYVVMALGPWSPLFAKSIGIRLPIQPGKGYSITYSRPQIAPKKPVVLKERSVCVTTWESGFRLGSTMEFSGYDSSLNRRRLDALERGAAEYLIEPVGKQKQSEWYGWRPMTYDDMPIIDTPSGFDRVMIASGHGMLGVSMSAATGHLVADLIAGREPIIDPAPCKLSRFY